MPVAEGLRVVMRRRREKNQSLWTTDIAEGSQEVYQGEGSGKPKDIMKTRGSSRGKIKD